MNVGGPSLHVLYLSRDLTPFGFETRLAVGEPAKVEGSMIPLCEANGIKPVIIPSLNRPIDLVRDIRAFLGIVNQIRDFRPHIVHTHTTKAGILGRLAAIVCRVPVIAHTFHGHVFEGYFSPVVSRGIVSFERFLARLSDAIITLSPGLREDFLSRMRIPRNDKVHVVPLGLELGKFLKTPRRTGTFRKSLGIPERAGLLGVVARLVPVKNHQGILRVFSRLVPKIPDLHLAFIGGGELETDIRREIRALGLGGRVHLTGIIHDIEAVYSDLDLLLLASFNEGTPVVIIEALSGGCPVASTPVGGVREILEGGILGTMIRPDEPGMAADLVSLLPRLLEAESRMQAARKRVSDKFGIPNLVGKVAEIYGGILRKRFRFNSSLEVLRRDQTDHDDGPPRPPGSIKGEPASHFSRESTGRP